jgi:hypothetical protein
MMKRTQTWMILALVGLALGVSASAKADTIGFVSFGSVSAQGVIFAAAGNAGNAATITAAFHQNGTQAFAPVDILLGSFGAGAFVQFGSISGGVNCCGNNPTTPPDGDPPNISGFPGSTSLSAFNGISGINAPTVMFLVGVFTNGNPGALSPPATLNFNTLTEGFSSLSPLINQTFFIGDGLTGSGSGSTQTFFIPAGATDLWLGFGDGLNFSGTPSFYGDNRGAFTGNYSITTPTTVPEPGSLTLFGIGLISLVNRLRRKQ